MIISCRYSLDLVRVLPGRRSLVNMLPIDTYKCPQLLECIVCLRARGLRFAMCAKPPYAQDAGRTEQQQL